MPCPIKTVRKAIGKITVQVVFAAGVATDWKVRRTPEIESRQSTSVSSTYSDIASGFGSGR